MSNEKSFALLTFLSDWTSLDDALSMVSLVSHGTLLDWTISDHDL